MYKFVILLTFCLSIHIASPAQVTVGGTQTNGSSGSNIITAVPFLLITPDARAGSMGNVGVATTGDVNSSSINAAKLAFLDDPYGISLSYSPWLKNLIPDVSLAYLSGFYKIDAKNTIGASLRYFSLGEVQLTDINQQPLGSTSPNELAVDFSYARSFGPEFSLGSSVRFTSSNLTSGSTSAGQPTRAGTAVSIDVGALYKSSTTLFGNDGFLSGGLSISNIGTKMSYSDGGTKYFLPANLKLGGAATMFIDDYNEITFGLDLNKLLVPTQPIYDLNGNIVSGKNPDRSVPSAIFGSFSDAPGGFSEEIKEVGLSTGLEYWYNRQFALRAGYNYENPKKGDNSYLTVGAGLRYNVFNIDFSYLIANVNENPLANTLRFSLLFNFSRK